MSREVDQRVVQMQFDNAQFERGAQQSLNTMERLKDAMNFESSAKGLDKVGEATKNLDLGPIEQGVQAITDRFSALGVIGLTVLQNLTNSAINMGKRLVTAIPKQIMSGGWTRANNIENAKFQLEGLGVEWQKIQEDLDYGVKDTAYGLDEAAVVASQLVASNIEVGDSMKQALRAVSGVAAMTNSSYGDIGRIFTTVAGQGRLMADQLNQLSARGMNAAAVLAKYLGKTEAEVREMTSKGQIDFATFAAAMDDAFGEHAKEANKTFNGAFANMKAALNRIGADFAMPLRDNLRDIFNAITPVINAIRKQLQPAVGWFSVAMSKVSSTVYKFMYALEKTGSIVDAISNANLLPPNIVNNLSKFASKFKEVVSSFKLSDSAGKNFKDTLSGIGRLANLAATAFIKLLTVALEPLATVISIVVSALLEVTGFLGRIITGVTSSTSVIKAANAVWSMFTGFLSNASDVIKNLVSSFGKLKEIKIELPDFSGLKNLINFESIGNGIVKVFGLMAKAINEFTSVLNAPSLTSILTTGVLGFGLSNLMQAFANTIGSPTGLKFLVGEFKFQFTRLSDTLKVNLAALEKSINADIIKKIATAIAILAAACWVLASIEPTRLAAATAAIGGLAAELMGSMSVFSKINSGGRKGQIGMQSMAIMMIEISVAILILASAVKKLGSMDIVSLGKGLIGVAASMGILVAASKLMSKNLANLTKTAFSMIIFAAALRVMANAVEAFSKIKATSMIKGLLGIGIAMAEMAGFAKLLNGAKINVGTGVAMIAIAAAMLIMAKAVEAFSKMDWESLGKGGAALAGILAVVAGFSQIAGGGGKMVGLGVSLIAISASLLIFAEAMKKIAELDWGQLARAGSAIVVFMAAVAGMSQLAAGGGKLLAMGFALIEVSTAMLIFAAAIGKISGMDWGQLAKAGAAVVVFMGAVTAMSRLSAGSGKLLAMGASIMLIAGALLVLSVAMRSLGSMSWEQLGKGLLGLVAVFAIIGTAGALLAPIAVPIAVIAAAMVAMSAAVFLLTSALLALNGASAMIGVALAALGEGIANALVSFVTALAAATGQMIPAIVMLIEGLCQALIVATPMVIQTLVVVLESALEAIVELTPVIVQAGFDLLVAFLQGIADNIGQVVDQAVNIITNFLDAVAARIPDVIQSGVNLFLGFIEGIAQALNDPNNQARLSAAISGLIMGVLNTGIAVIAGFLNPFKTIGQKIMNSGLVQGIKSKLGQIKTKIREGIQNALNGIKDFPSKFLQFGKDLVQGIINGIGSLAKSLWNSVTNLVTGALNSGKSAADSNSPSKETTKQGIWMGQGYVIGVQKMAPAVADAMSDMVYGGLESAAYAMSKMDDSYAYTPQITPVVDMSNVDASIGDISSLFANTSAADLTANISGEMDANKAVLDYISNLDKANSRRNNDVVSALRDLQRDFQTLGERIDNIEMVMDSGEVVGALTGKMDRALGRQVSRRNRGI